MNRLACVLVAVGALLFGSAVSGSAAPGSATAPPSALRQAATALVAAGAPGVTVLVRKPGKTIRLARGVANRITKRPLVAPQPFRVGSITKTFVATVVLQLEGEGMLTVDDPVERWLPGLVRNGENITLRVLLSHRSGLYDYLADPKATEPYVKNPRFNWAPRKLVALALAHPARFAPGERYEYSNTNYILLGLVVEAATGNTLGAELKSRIFDPLGLANTRYAAGTAVPKDIAHGYVLSEKPPLDVTFYNASYAGAAGAIVSTTDDLARFDAALLGGKVLPAEQLQEMEAAKPIGGGNGYGLGLLRLRLPCGTFWGHNGSMFGYEAFMLSSLDRRRQVAIGINADELSPQATAAYDRLLVTAACR